MVSVKKSILGKESDWLDLCQVFILWLWARSYENMDFPTIARWRAKVLQEDGMALRNVPDVSPIIAGHEIADL